MKTLLITFFLLIFFSAYSQQKFSKQLSVISDNDLYVSTYKDRYYTNGLFLKYKYLGYFNNEKLSKKMYQWEIGHKMYTPANATFTSKSQQDRAFAAYLYAGFGITNIYKKNKIFSNSIEIGVIGDNAFGRELQDFIHKLYGFKKATGWDYQIKNALDINFKTQYTTFLVKNTCNFLDISWINTVNVGTIFTDISSGFYGRIGLKPLEKITNSIAFNTHLNNQKTTDIRAVESFLFIKPSIRLALYDATIEGSFLNPDSEVTTPLVPFVFLMEIGIKFTANRFQFNYIYQYHTNKSKGLRFSNGNKYGTIGIHYLMY